MNQPDAGQLECPLAVVDARHPAIGPPISEYTRVVVSEYINVRPVDKVVRQYILITAFVQWTNHANIRRREVVLNTDTSQNSYNNIAYRHCINYMHFLFYWCYVSGDTFVH